MKTILKKRNAKNKVYVWKGYGYQLDVIVTNRNKLSIEELAYICIKSGKGCFYTEDGNQYDERYYYVDLSEFGLQNGYFLVENLKTYNVEIHS